MMDRKPPRIADWLLRRSEQEPLIGDITEEYRRGRTAGWYWRQTIGALAAELRQRSWIARHKLTAFLVAWLADFLVILSPQIPGIQIDSRIASTTAAAFLAVVLFVFLRFWSEVKPRGLRAHAAVVVFLLLADGFVLLMPWTLAAQPTLQTVTTGEAVFLTLALVMCLEFCIRLRGQRGAGHDDLTLEGVMKPRLQMILYFLLLVSIDSLCFLTATLFPSFRAGLPAFVVIHVFWLFRMSAGIVWEAREVG